MRAMLVVLSGLLIIGCSQSKRELYKITDGFVGSLQVTYESYGILGGEDFSRSTSDGLYVVMPIGRLINVKIQKVVGMSEYEKLRSDLRKHYKNDSRVRDVYICQAGTIMIDCRR